MIFLNKKDNKKGFTLVELMVATSLFLIIMISALGALLMLIGEARNSRALRISMENVNFAMESMARSIRMGTGYYCGDIDLDDFTTSPLGCQNGNDIFSFIPQSIDLNTKAPSRVIYSFEDNTIKRYDYLSPSGVPIVSPNVNIEKLEFYVDVLNHHPRVYIILKGTVMVKGVPTNFAIQTMASQRNF